MTRLLAVAAACLAGSVLAQDASPGDDGEGTATLDTMTVLGSPEELSRTAGSAHRIEADVMQLFGHDDINRVLGQVPGVYLREEDGYGLRPNIGLRGASSDRSQKVTLLEDGVLFGPAPYAAPAAYYFPMTARMNGVEVYKGPASIQHGPQTIGGAVNLVTAPIPEQPRAMLEVSGGDHAYRRLHGSGGGALPAGFGVHGELIHVATQGFKQLDGGGDTGFEKTEAVVKAGRAIGPGRLELRAGYSDEVSDETYLGLTEKDFRATPLRRYRASALDLMDWTWNGARADWTQAVMGGEARITGYSHRFARAWTKFNDFADPDTDIRAVLADPDTPTHALRYAVLTGESDGNPDFEGDDLLIGTNDRRYDSSGVQGRVNWVFVDAVSQELELGLRVHRDRVQRLHDSLAHEMLDGVPVRNAVPRAVTADNRATAVAVAAWIRDDVSFGRWSLAPGLRVEHVNTGFEDFASGQAGRDHYAVLLPGLGAHFQQTETLGWLAGVHRGFSPASPAPDGRVEPEIALNTEAGLRWHNGFGRLEVIGFHSAYSNLTAQCTFSAGCADAEIGEQTNAGRVRVLGVESSLERDVVLASGHVFPMSAGYTWTRGEFREAFGSANPQFGQVQPGFELPYVPRHRASLRLGWRAPAFETQLSLYHESAMRDVAGAGPIPDASGSDAHTVLDVAASAALWRGLSLVGRIDNLADESYVAARRPFGARPGKPRTFQVGLEWRFEAD